MLKPRQQKLQSRPWLDLRLTKETMNYLWDIINHTDQQADPRREVGGPNSDSYFIQDNKDNWFYKNTLRECSEALFFKDWDNYYNIHVLRGTPPPIFELTEMWVNQQKQNEVNPAHVHGGNFSFVIFMKIPTHWKEQHALPINKNVQPRFTSNFQFLLPANDSKGGTTIELVDFKLSPEDEGRMLFFPADLTHLVYPFYGTKEKRITISGNIFLSPAWLKKQNPDDESGDWDCRESE